MKGTFTIKPTPHGCTVTYVAPRGRTETKRFRNGYASALTNAKTWIEQQITQLKFHAPEGVTPEFEIIQIETT